MMQVNYATKKDLKTNIGNTLSYVETSVFGPEYLSNGTFLGINRPTLSGFGREFIAEITMENDKIKEVK